MFRSVVLYFLCTGLMVLAMSGFQLAAAQVPDVGPGQCVQASGTCNDPSPRYGRSSGGGSSSPSARQRAALQHQQIMNGMMLNTMQGLMNNFMQGFQQGMEQNRQRQLQQQEALLRQAREEMERERQRALAAQRAMQRNRLELQAAKERIAGAVRSMSATGAPMRPLLSVGEEPGAFGTRELKPRGMEAVTAMDAGSKAACGQGLLNAAGAAAVSGSKEGLVASFKEAAFLSRQANQAISGGRLDVACPGEGDVASFGESDDLNQISEMIQRQSEVFGALYDRLADDMGRMTESRKLVDESKVQVEEAQSVRDEAAQMVEQLQAEMLSSEDLPAASGAVAPDDLEAKQTALAEALSALEQSEQALANVQQIYDRNKSSMDELESSMKSMETLMKKSTTDPEGMADLREQLGLAVFAAE